MMDENLTPKILTWLVLISFNTIAQVPQKFNFQAILRNSSGLALDSIAGTGKLTATISNSMGGNQVFTWSKVVSPNRFGQVSVMIGEGSNFNNVKWGVGEKYLTVLIRKGINGDGQILLETTQQIGTNPLAFFADSAAGARNAKRADFATSAGTAQTAQVANNVVQEWAYFADIRANNQFVGPFVPNQWIERSFSLVNQFPISNPNIQATTNGVRLAPGTYEVRASAPAIGVAYHKIKFSENSSDENELQVPMLHGSSAYNVSNTTDIYNSNTSVIDGILVVPPGPNRLFKIWHKAAEDGLNNPPTSNVGQGIGSEQIGSKSVYTQLVIKKLK